jgi:hypothetical protein
MGADAPYVAYTTAITAPDNAASAATPYLDGSFTSTAVATQFLPYCKAVATQNKVDGAGALRRQLASSWPCVQAPMLATHAEPSQHANTCHAILT